MQTCNSSPYRYQIFV